MNKLSDREIDFAVAEKITLWKPIGDSSDGWASFDGSQKHWPGPPEYSSDIKAAMEVLARCDVWHVEKSDLAEQPYHVFVANHKGEHSSTMKTAEVEGDNLPRLICLAALAACGKG